MNKKIEKFIASHEFLGVVALVAVVIGLTVMLTDIRSAVVTVITYAAFALPGILCCRKINLPAWQMVIFGVPVGLGITSLVIVVVVCILGWQISFVALAWFILSLFFLLVPSAFLKSNNNVDLVSLPNSKEECGTLLVPVSISISIALFALLVFIPLSKVGVLTEHGYAFTALFSHDFILRSLDAVTLANSIPADNYFFNGEVTKNYYLLWYILPATVYNLLGKAGNIREIVAVICVLNVPFFLLLFYLTLRDFLGKRLACSNAPTVFFLIVFCASYHWIFVAAKAVVHALQITSAEKFFSTMHAVSQTWYRDLIFEPHCILALMLFFCLFALSRQPVSIKRGMAVGVLLSLIALSDTAIFLIVACWHFICITIGVLRTRKLDGLYDALAAAGTGVGVVVLMVALGVFGVTPYSNHLVVRPYMFVIISLPVFLVLHYGVTSLTWLSVVRDKTLDKKWQLLLLALLSIFFMMFVTESLEGNVVLRKALKICRVPFALFTGYYLCCFAGSKLYRVVVCLLLLMLPTYFSDIWALTNVMDKEHTSYIIKDDMEAALWIKNNTPRDSVVQGIIDYPGYYDFSLTACFGERKAAMGHWKMAYQRYPNLPAIQQRAREVDDLFGGDNPGELSVIKAKKLGIDYVFVGLAEQERYSKGERNAFRRSVNGGVKPVYDHGGVMIYKISED